MILVRDMSTLYQRLEEKNITFSHVCEVGVFEPETSNVLGFLERRIRATLVEADPERAKRIAQHFSDYPVTVYPVAVWDYMGKQRLARAKASTFVVELQSSPALENDHYQLNVANTFETECIIFSSIDTQEIDLISIDIEGGEWYVLKHMLSRPKVISLETHGKNYVNPFIEDITAWMRQNGYVIWYKDNTDSIYIQQGLFSISWLDELMLTYKNFRLAIRRRKGLVFRYLRIR